MRGEQLGRLLEGLYATATAGDDWCAWLAEVSDAFRGAAAFLTLDGQRSGRPPVGFSPSVDLSVMQKYFEQFYGTDMHLAQMAALRLPAGSHGLRRELGACEREYLRSPYFNECLRPQGVTAGESVGGILATEGGMPVANLSLFTRRRMRELDEDDVADFGLLLPHVMRARGLWLERRAAAGEAAQLQEVLDLLPSAVMLVDRRGRVARLNSAAHDMLARGDGLRAGPAGLSASDPATAARLRRLLEQAGGADALRGRAGGALLVPRPSGLRPYHLTVTPLLAAAGSDGPLVAVFVHDPAGIAVPTPPEVFAVLYELTPAEAELAALLARGLDLRAAAERRGVTIATARSQLKLIFSKTGTRRQAELVRLLSSFAAPRR